MSKLGTLTKAEVLAALKHTDGLPIVRMAPRRTIYEAASGGFYIDYAAYPGGTTGEVPRHVIEELEKAGCICRAFPNSPHANAWKLSESQ